MTSFAQVWLSASQYVPGAQDWVCFEWPLQANAAEADIVRAKAQIVMRIIAFLRFGYTLTP
ncbi:hypothetical protein AVO44_02475 [Ruegeria profundi]|uniref:Uncharacterized protein n=1 Tax=Ruegeria profundi TaxID=1685378 RepID=A0A0X3U2Y4_9RHOB|nr:hypothetical protein [Ruegeria profundi]KUJ82154.1 hypothetical protein AVO44_02475 [Ruegeria profundi]